MAQTETTTTETVDRNGMGAAGWFSAAGFVIMGLLYLLDVTEISTSVLSPIWTLVIALVAGIGAVLLYYGDDPTA
ncbi:hypothetical protein [Candidatus Halobonum tyrrellensis]|uniref:Uncharacterized protein n=1 Tax=Candidatus Halobonum tyrrellensis G22 TaxID=1324957 RepID=V4GVB9_9EURY|nr:hypothetical protein [Candidatus Halobonum tyrrellensis]ESP89111.1 hypothetical protein K933_05888 [Candidatus Halobonum tyrrellensis G22]